MLKHIEFENYRIFKKRQILEIKPITILFGKNNAGKSAVMKLPSLVAAINHSETPESFFTTFRGIKICDAYRDLIYGKASNAVYIKSTSDNSVTEIMFHVDLDKPVFEKYEREVKNSDVIFYLDYIGPFREEPKLDLRIESQVLKRSEVNGINTYQVLLRDMKNPNHSICDKVSKWYQDNFEGWSVVVNDKQEPVYHIEMKNNGFSIPIQDCGTGIIQSLPIVIRACQKAENPTLVVFEEPESHLNPAAHAELCQLIVDSTEEDENKRYLIETHSHTFILRLQRLLAEGKLSPDNVALYYVQYNEVERSSQLERIEMMQDGSIPQWPKGIFEEVMDEILAINNQRILRRK